MDVLSLLIKGEFATHRITIPEGWNSRDIADSLAEQKLVDREKFLAKCTDPAFIQSMGLNVASLEGYLYPDTYALHKPRNEEEVWKK